MMTFTQIDYVLKVSKYLNFRKAAQACHVTQPTLSAQIKKLEEELNVVIFDRSIKPVRPTKLGKALIAQFKEIQSQALKVNLIINENHNELSGSLKVAIIPTLMPYLTPLFLDTFTDKYKEVELSLIELTTQNCLEKLNSEEIDLAIIATKENSSDYFQNFLFEEKMYAYVNKKYSHFNSKYIDLSKVDAKDVWLLEEGHCFRDEVIKACKLRRNKLMRPLGIDIKIGGLETIRHLVSSNFGMTLIPGLSLQFMNKDEMSLVKQIEGIVPKRKIYSTTRRRYLKEKLIETFNQEVVTITKKFL